MRYNMKHEEYLSDAARCQIYGDIELAALGQRIRTGVRVRYSSVGESGIRAGVYDEGTVTNYDPKTGLAQVRFDDANEPAWLDGRRLYTARKEGWAR